MAIPRAFASLSLVVALLLVVAPVCPFASNILYPGSSLGPGGSLTYGSYTLVMQQDCNLVLYDICNAVWASNTGGRDRNCRLSITSIGNLVILRPSGQVLWSINRTTGAQGNYVLVLQEDRNIVLYGPGVWSPQTQLPRSLNLLLESGATISGALPANKTTEETKAAEISMVVNE